MIGRLRCPRCAAGLVPGFATLGCPQLDDCDPSGREVLALVAPLPPQ